MSEVESDQETIEYPPSEEEERMGDNTPHHLQLTKAEGGAGVEAGVKGGINVVEEEGLQASPTKKWRPWRRHWRD